MAHLPKERLQRVRELIASKRHAERRLTVEAGGNGALFKRRARRVSARFSYPKP
jgi:hypothetical protein